jgi:hypothetical protein
MLDEVISKVCPRCGGSGRYSYNSRDGDTCYGCGGTGRVVDQKKSPKIKPTLPANDLRHAWPGDVLKYDGILCRIEFVHWISYEVVREAWLAKRCQEGGEITPENYERLVGLRFPGVQGNQCLVATRLVDGKRFRLYRDAWQPGGLEFQAPCEWHKQPVERADEGGAWKV